MENYLNLNCFSQNKLTENIELCNENSSNNSIFISGLCDSSTFDLSNQMWKQETLDSCISVLNPESQIQQVDSINAKIEILNNKVIETPSYASITTDNYEGKKTTGRKLIVQGVLCLTVNYIENSSSQPVNSFIGTIPFSSYIILPKKITNQDTLNLKFLVSSCLQEIHINDVQSKHIYLSATFTLLAEKMDNLCNSDPNNDCPNFNNNSCMTLDSPNILGICPVEKIRNLLTSVPNPQLSVKYWNEVSVPEVLTISESKPDVEQLLSLASDIEILCKKIIKTPTLTTGPSFENKMILGKKLLIEAVLHQRITYISKDDSNSIYSCNFNIPISTYIILPNETSLTDKFDLIACIEDIYACVLNDRQIFKGVNIFFKATPNNCINAVV